MVRVCVECGKEKPLDAFCNGGRRRVCRGCVSRLRKVAEKDEFGGDLRKVSVDCLGCGKPVTVEVEPETKLPRMLCGDCKAFGAAEHRGAMSAAQAPISNLLGFTNLHGPVTVWRPGEPTFHFLAKELSKHPPRRKGIRARAEVQSGQGRLF